MRLEKSINASINAGPRDPAEANVTARLFKSNPVQNALPEILNDIRTLLGVDETSTKKQPQKKADQKATQKDESMEESANEPESTPDEVSSKSAKDEKSKAEYLNDINVDDVSDGESMDLSYFDARLASASDGSDSDDDDISPIKPALNSNKITPKFPDNISISSAEEASSISEYSEPEPESESDSPPPLTKSKPSKQDTNVADKPKDTTFLPSLMMGGYWSGSDSEPEEDDEVAAAATGSGKPARKNRMGQQARRALWEKKFGARAKHIQEEQQKKGSRNNSKNSGWDARRGATDDNDNGPRWGGAAGRRQYTGSSSRNGDGGEKDVRKENAIAANKKKAYDGLHPSWEAARKAKQEKAQASFQGKKITFD